jgi:hypothetical protein
MASTYYPSKDAELVVWMSNFVNIANANLASLGLVAADLTPLSTIQPTYTSNLNDVEAKKMALANAVETKDTNKAAMIQKLRVVVNKIQANPAVPSALKASLGISTYQAGQFPAQPLPPTDLVANILPDGTIELKWKRNGNSPNTLFAIHAQVGSENFWTLVNVITKTRYTHVGVLPGVQVKFLVKAKKADYVSGPSNIAMVNAGGLV